MIDSKKHLIGRTDIVDFPIFELWEVAVKVDTGAYTSSIHCKDIEEIDETLRCSFVDLMHPKNDKKHFIFKNYDITAVKSSNGTIEIRYAVRSKIVLFGKTYPITLTLTSREDMRYPVLLGRKFLSGKMIVDPQLENLSYKHKTNEH